MVNEMGERVLVVTGQQKKTQNSPPASLIFAHNSDMILTDAERPHIHNFNKKEVG